MPSHLDSEGINGAASQSISDLVHFDDNFCRFFDFAVAETSQNFEHFAPSRKLTAALAFVSIHCLHEIDFFVVVIALAGSGIDLPAAFDFSTDGLSTLGFLIVGISFTGPSIRQLSALRYSIVNY